jgi:chitinase
MAAANGAVEVPVALSAASASTVTVNYATVNGTARAAHDFAATSGTLTFAPGHTVEQVPVSVLPDGQAGSNLTFTLKLSTPSNSTLGLSSAVITLVDPAGPMTVTAGNALALPGAGQHVVPFPVDLSTPVAPGHVVTVRYWTVAGSALSEVDYLPVTGTLTFSPGQSAKTVAVTIRDTSTTTTKRFTLDLGGAVGAALATSTVVGVIGPGTSPPTPVASTADVAAVMGSTSVVDVPVDLSWASTAPVTVAYHTVNGTALAGHQYASTSGTLTFAPGQRQQEVPVNLDADAEAGPNLAFSLALSAPSGATLGLTPGTVTLVDPAGPMTAYVDSPTEPASVSRTMGFTVSLSAPVAPGSAVSLTYRTSPLTALPGKDYTTASGTLRFTSGRSTMPVAVPVLDHAVAVRKQFELLLSTVATGAVVANSTGVATIAIG